jgi:hypothetical protein
MADEITDRATVARLQEDEKLIAEKKYRHSMSLPEVITICQRSNMGPFPPNQSSPVKSSHISH